MIALILASASPHRRSLLEAAGMEVQSVAAQIDERAVEAALDSADGEVVAAVLAQAKAQEVSSRYREAMVIGADQSLELDGEIFHKPRDMEEARRNLLRLSGRTHYLHSAAALSWRGETVWNHVESAAMTMRNLAPAYVGRYLAKAGERALGSVGGYQIEAEGINLFEKIEGDFFTIVGLPLLALLSELRKRKLIDG